ncbi:baseplate wedge subunit [Mammaliicoccus virus vB_MscM-PMS2]|nr:baseplate wedge subunit [Mammaliicoccus virus vB_MscM-PMS2]
MRFKKHIVQQGDTLQTIAQRYYNDVSAWIDLIEFNRLEYPYIVDSPELKKDNLEHLVTYGDTIIIPQESELTDYNLGRITNKDKELMLELSFGRDLDVITGSNEYLTSGTYDDILGLTQDNQHKDLSTLGGIDNMKQVLTMRLLTAKGSHLLHPEYGSDLHLLFGYAVPEQATLVELEVIRCLLRDTRVQAVSIVDYEIKGNTYNGKFDVQLQGEDDLLTFVLNADSEGIVARFE